MSQHSRHNDPGAPGVNLGLIITPMLDMSFQILSFFIMTYNPSILEGHINGKLVPPTEPAIAGKQNNVPTDKPLLPDTEPDLENTLQVIVKAIPKGAVERQRADGEPAQIFVKNKEDTEATRIADTDEKLEVSLKRLETKLKAVVAATKMKSNIRLECEGDLKHQYVMQIYDVCKGSGYQNVSFVAPAPERKK